MEKRDVCKHRGPDGRCDNQFDGNYGRICTAALCYNYERISVVKPSHYGKNDPYKYALDNNLGPLEMNAIKYVTRHEKKNGKEDIEKAINTLQRLLKEKYGS